MRNYGINDTFSALNSGLSDVLSTYLNVNIVNHNFFFAVKLNDFANNSSFPLSLIYYKREDNNGTKPLANEMFPNGLRLSLYRSFSISNDVITMQNADGRKLEFTNSNGIYKLEGNSSYIQVSNNDYYYIDVANGLTYKYSSNYNYPYSVVSDDINKFPSLNISISSGKITNIIFDNGYKASFTYTNNYVNNITILRKNSDSTYSSIEKIDFSYSNSNNHIELSYNYYYLSSDSRNYYSLVISLLEANNQITFSDNLNENLIYSFNSDTSGAYYYGGNVYITHNYGYYNIGALSYFDGKLGISWNKLYHVSGYVFEIKVFGKSGLLSTFNVAYYYPNGIKLSIGRKLNEETIGNKIDSYPFFGCLSNVIFYNDALSAFPTLLNNVIDRLSRIDNKYHKITKNCYIGDSFKSEYIEDSSKGSGETYNKHLIRYDQLKNIGYNTFKNTYSYNSLNLLTSVYSTESNSAGNISSKTINYSYDALYRLKTYSDSSNNKTVSYSYTDGKISTVLTVINGNTTSKAYLYDSLGRLCSVGSDQITYNNNSLRPASYKGNSFSYQGNLLTNISSGGSAPIPSMSFTYDYQNRRLTKIVNGLTHRYYYDGYSLIYEKVYNSSGSLVKTIQFFYDENGKLIFFKLDNTKYFYYIDSYNIVRGITNTNGQMLVKYDYDPWGNVTNIVDNSSISLSTINPFLFKQYYYDHESSWYYCINRYYVPEWYRWLTPDEHIYLDYESVNGYNPYVYCNNNPVMYEDGLGCFSIGSFLTGLAIFTIIGATVGATTYTALECYSYVSTGEWSWSWGQFGGNILGGALGGALTFICPKAPAILISGLTGFTSTAFSMMLQNELGESNYSHGQIFFSSMFNGLVSVACSVIFDSIPIKGINSGSNSYLAISKQILTKFRNGTISKISYNTFSKILTYNLISSLVDIEIGCAISSSGIDKELLSICGKYILW